MLSKSVLEKQRSVMRVMVGTSLGSIAIAAWAFAVHGADRYFYTQLSVGIVLALIPCFIWLCPLCNVLLGKARDKTSCPKSVQSFISDTDTNAHTE